MHRKLLLLTALLGMAVSNPARALSQEEDASPSTFALFTFGYLTPQEGLVGSATLQFTFFAGNQLIGPAASMDVIVTQDEDSPYHRDASGLCRDSEDDQYVDDILCTPDTSLAYRGELWFRIGGGPLSVGPGIRLPGTGDPGEIEPYGFVVLGDDVFAKASIGSGFQHFEAGIRFGL